jgi:hypothetical protein
VRGERYVVVGLANARATWFSEVARWSTSAALPAEFVKCVSVEEVRARLGAGRTLSAAIVDARVPGVDRDLVALARDQGVVVLVVDDVAGGRDWHALGAAAVLPPDFGRGELLDALDGHATRICRGDTVDLAVAAEHAGGPRGSLVAVVGAGGVGVSVVAMALAQALAQDGAPGSVVLADLALHADQAMLHDAGDIAPGVQELVESHRTGHPSADEVRRATFAVDDRDYRLLLGLRRHRDWTAIRPRVFEAALDGLRRAFGVVVADVDADLEGEGECGSVDVEERNAMARTAVRSAGVVVVVGLPGPKGVRDLSRTARDVVALGTSPGDVVTVVNRAPRNPRARAEIESTVAALTPGTDLAAPVLVPERRRFDELLRDAARLPVAMGEPVAAAVRLLLARPTRPGHDARAPEPVAVVPGSLGRWHDAEASA